MTAFTAPVDWLIVFEDQDHQNMAFSDEEAARKTFEMKKQNWSCHLFRRVESAAGIDYPKAFP